VHLTLPFTLEKEDDVTATYVEQAERGKPPVVGTISVNKSFLSDPPPSVIRVTLALQEGRPVAPEPPGPTLSRWRSSIEMDLKAGDRVTVVKNRLGGVASPPEWLEQSLGKIGTVLWTSRLGAMVALSGHSNWFPYAELEREDSAPDGDI
jgi:hypothetical protein